MKFKIRRLKKQEAVKVQKIVYTVLESDFPEYEKRVVKSYQKIFNKKFFLKLIQKEGVIFGAFDTNVLIGIVAIRKEFGGVGFIEWLAIDKRHKGKGLGSLLLKKAAEWLLSHKYHCMYLYTESQKNIRFYKNRGFEFVGTMRKAWFGADGHKLQKLLRDKPFKEVFEKYLKK